MPTPDVPLVGTLSASSGGVDRIHVNGPIGNPLGSVTLKLAVPFSLIDKAHKRILKHAEKTPDLAGKKREVVVNVVRKTVRLSVK
jgi:hypothetical protein